MPEEELYEGPSKSEVKRQMTALQKIGEELVGLSEREFAKIPIESEDLQLAIEEAHRISSNNARKRHLQYIGKVMRNIDTAPIVAALDALHQQHAQKTAAFHELEALRDQLLADGDAALEPFIAKYPQADRQHMRQLIRQHQRELAAAKPAAASRKLFKYLRQLTSAD